MEIQTLRTQPHLSASSITDYLECGLLYKLSRLDKLPPTCRRDTAEVGSAIHQSLADFYRAKQQGKELTVEELLEAFRYYWQERAADQKDLQYSQSKNFAAWLAVGQDLLTTYYQSLPPDNFQVMAVEQAFQFTLEGVDIPIIGIFDLVQVDAAGTIIITDWKTTSRAYSSGEVDKHLQMGLYHLAVKANGYHDQPILLKLDCLIKTKKPRLEQYYTIRTLADEQRLRKKVQAVYHSICQEVFIPNDTSWRCPHCAYQVYCDAWFAQ